MSAITPRRVFLDRTVDVSISGVATAWTDAVKLDFGAGVTVNSTRVASPTAIVASITVSRDAATGARDVTVTQGDATTTFKGAFDVASPLAITGTAAQGSIVVGTLRQLDVSTPFDTTTEGDGLFTEISYPNLSIGIGSKPGVAASVQSASPFSLSCLMLVDVETAAGKADLTVKSGAGDDVVSSAGSIEIAARAPTVLSASTKGTITSPGASLLYKYTAAADELVTFTASATSAQPGIALLPASGKFADMFGFGASHSISAKKDESFYLVTWDSSGASGYTFDLGVKSVAGVPETEPNDACGAAMAITAGEPVFASFANDADEDWYAVTAGAGDVGKKIHVVTFPGEPDTDTLVDVLAGDCTTSLGGPSSDDSYHEDFKSSAIAAAGTYYVKVSASPFGFTGSKYTVLVTLE